MEVVDLHTHTTASDGSFSPAEVVAMAKAAGLKAVAITDHDTVGGVQQALEAGVKEGIEVVGGVEISVNRPDGKGSMHILGLMVDHTNPQLLTGLQRLQQARAERNPKIVKRLNALGIDITMEEVEALAGGDQVGRPHFAQALVHRGVVADRAEAFERFLASGRPAYEPKFRFEPPQAIALLRSATALPILAHPGLLGLTKQELKQLLVQLKGWGLEGIEAYYSEHTHSQQQMLLELAQELGLAVSGGSDFHGAAKPDISLGTGMGNLAVPASVLNALYARHQELFGA